MPNFYKADQLSALSYDVEFVALKVRFKRGCLVLERFYAEGDELDVVEPHASHLVNTGAAEFVGQ